MASRYSIGSTADPRSRLGDRLYDRHGREHRLLRVTVAHRCAGLASSLKLRAMATPRERSRNLVRLAAALQLWSALGVLNLVACKPADQPIVIGLAGPFSLQSGQSMQLAAQLAVAEINQRGGIDGRQIQLAVRDDSGSVGLALRVARSFYDSPDVAAVIGHMGSAETLAAARVYNSGDNPVVSISPSASSPDISDAGPYTFRVCPDDGVHAAQLADWAYRRLGARRVAVLYENDAYGRGLRTAFRNSFTELGGRIVSEDPFSPALPGFEPYLTRIRLRGGADALLLAGALDGAERMLRTLNNLQSNQTVLGGDGIGGIEAAQVDAEGVFVSLAYLHDQPGPRNEAFTSAYRRMYGEQPPDHRGAGAYDIVYLLSRVIDQVGPDRSRIRDYLAGLGTETEPFEGVTGSIGFDRNRNVVDRNVVIAVVRDKRLVSAERR